MGFQADEEILQDFLVEAGEILEKLSEQLVDLEQHPDDMGLLNAIFRGFHTVKGGAGFLQLEALVECCHVAENVFDTLRNGKRRVTPELMDVVLQALDTVNEMFEQVQQREEPDAASPELIAELQRLALPEEEAETAAPEPVSQNLPAEEVTAEESAPQGDITDDEFEQLLNALEHPDTQPAETESAVLSADADSDEISDDEFEALLDQLHGKGKFTPEVVSSVPAAASAADSDSDEITDDEFEALLDQLHGKGKFDPTTATAADAPAPVESVEPAPASSTPASVEKPAPAPAKAPAPSKTRSQPAAREREVATAAAETTVRVDTKRLDDIMNMVGELVLVRNRLKRLGDESGDEQMMKAVSNLDVVTADLQTAVMQTRMQPIKKVFGRFPRVVRDLARGMKKEINLVLKGEETDLDKNLVEALADPLVHLVRNSVDHGIEAPEIREQQGKPREGLITLAAAQEGDHILLTIEDDGAGMNADILRRKAVEKGMMDADAAERLTPSECYNLIFAPGFSTKTEISDVSGRGVGMDVVKTKITQLNGSVFVHSEMGKGTRIEIKVPLTLAIMPTLMVMLGNQSFALPLVSVVEIFHLDISRTNIVDGQECIVVRENVYPLFHVKRWLVKGTAWTKRQEGFAHVVIVAVGNKKVGLVVDQLIGQEEVVIKPLGTMLHGTPGMAGATITGDGRIALILDVPSLLARYARAVRG